MVIVSFGLGIDARGQALLCLLGLDFAAGQLDEGLHGVADVDGDGWHAVEIDERQFVDLDIWISLEGVGRAETRKRHS